MKEYDLNYGYTLVSKVPLAEEEIIIGLIVNMKVVPIIEGERLHFEVEKPPLDSPKSEFDIGGEHFYPCDLITVSYDKKRGIIVNKRKNLPDEFDVIYEVTGYEKIVEDKTRKIAKTVEIDADEFFSILKYNSSEFAIKENNPASVTNYSAIPVCE